MVTKLIFLSMAAIDHKKAEKYQWLPSELFPLLTHRIAASGRPDDGDEFSFVQGKRDVCEGGRLDRKSVV